jgi:acyl-coenzyme A synthetase/AMP-(fatty) acid ligase
LGERPFYGHFLSDVATLADLLPEKPTVINLADDRYRFLVGFAVALVRGQTTLLPPSRAPGAAAQLAQEYGNSYCLVDGTEHVEQLPSYKILTGTGSQTDRVKVPQSPIHHTALVAFTSGSTGSPHPHSKAWAP